MNTVRFFLLFFFSKSFLFTFFVLFSWARSVISHHSISCIFSSFSGPQNTRGQAAGRFGRVGIGRSITKGSTHIVVVIFVLCVSILFFFVYLLATASKGRFFGSGEQCQNWHESPKASGSTNSYGDVTW